MRALRRDMAASADQFPQDVQELQAYFEPAEPGQVIRAIPGAGLRVPLWLLGSSLFSAQLAAMLGLPFAFASHFAPDQMMQALQIYRSRFQPSAQLKKPHAMLTINVLAADTDQEARHQFTSQQQAFVNHQRGTPGQVPPAIDDINSYCSPAERAGIDHTLGQSIVGSTATVESRLRTFLERTRPDELMVTSLIHDQQTRLHSLRLIAEIRDRIHANSSSAQALSGL
jgi:luciferase family oxidoreductase group 1